jgi:hypothetical protein
MALSPPKASNTGLRAIHAAERDRTASALIQPIVMAWIRRIRRSVADAGAGSAEFIEEDYDTLAEQRDRERLPAAFRAVGRASLPMAPTHGGCYQQRCGPPLQKTQGWGTHVSLWERKNRAGRRLGHPSYFAPTPALISRPNSSLQLDCSLRLLRTLAVILVHLLAC